MKTVVINGTPRTEFGKKATRALRRAGNVPCNLYGGSESVSFHAPVPDFRKLIYTPDFRFAEVQVGGKSYKAILKDAQFDPISDELLHVDFQEVVETRKLKVSVLLHLNGTPKGIAKGGKLDQAIRKLPILALPKDIPYDIHVDVSDMDLGDIKRVRDVEMPGVTYLLAPSNPIASIHVPRAAKEEPAATATPAAAAPAASATPAAGADAAKKDEKKK